MSHRLHRFFWPQIMNLDYLAGFIDGEGTVGLSKRKNSYIPYVSISNTNAEVIKQINLELNGINSTTVIRKAMKANHKDALGLTVRWQHAIKLCVLLKDKLIIKHNQANIIVNEYPKCTPRNGRYNETNKKAKQVIVNKLHLLNSRGNYVTSI